MESIKYAKLCLHATTTLFANHIVLIGSYNKLMKMKITTKTGNNKKLNRKVPEKSVEAI